MVKKLDTYQSIANRMIDADRQRDKAFAAYQAMYHNQWDMPEELNRLGWMRRTISTDPHDAIVAGDRVLSAIHPKVKITPSRDIEAQRQDANQMERILKWHLLMANRRRGRSVTSDVVRSALLYDAVAMNVIDLDWQIKQADAIKASTKRYKAARKICRYVVNVYNPRHVHALRSGYGTESVLLCQTRPASEIMDEWGDVGKKLRDLVEQDAQVKYYDYTDYEDRVVWIESGETIELVRSAHELPFLPWVANMGGTSLEEAEADKYHPMLYPLYTAETWDTMNILMSLQTTDAIVKAFKPDFIQEGVSSELAETDYTDPTGLMKAPIGDTIKQTSPTGLDPAKSQWMAELKASMQQSTVSSILMGGGAASSGMAFASLNLMTQTAVGALKPAKELAEKSLAEMFEIMLGWSALNGGIDGYGTGKDDMGKRYSFEANVIDPDLYLEVELVPDVPTDRMQRANTAMILNQLGYPREKILEEVGEEDPEMAMRMWYKEKRIEHLFNLMQQGESMQMQQGIQMEAQQAQMEQQMQAEMAAQQAQQQAPGQFPGGQGFNPGFGGTPPAMANPDMTREALSGMDMGGMGGVA